MPRQFRPKSAFRHLRILGKMVLKDLALLPVPKRTFVVDMAPPIDSGHPIQDCHCECGREAPRDQHEDSCRWARLMCRKCEGWGRCTTCHEGTCSRCAGDGTDPEPPIETHA